LTGKMVRAILLTLCEHFHVAKLLNGKH
jgi:hypothetical protein